MMIELNVVQGGSEWHAARANCFNASEAPAMMGVSSYMTRSELLKIKATGITPEIDTATQRRFDKGHQVEAMARPLAEAIIGEELYPIVATDDAGRLLASSDGATMLCNIGFEHKLWNVKIAEQVANGNVPESHKWQLDQQIAVFGFEKVIFVCSDGTSDNFVYCEYRTTPERIEKLKAGWRQFAIDLAAYKHVEEKPAAVAAPIDDLPALVVEMVGQVTSSNLATFQTVVMARIQAINTDIQTDDDFATAEKMVKFLDDGEKKLELVKSQALSQTASIDQLFRTIASLQGEMAAKRLTLDKLVKARKESIKVEIQQAGKDALAEHIAGLNKRLGSVLMPSVKADFAEAMKGKRSITSLHDAVDTELARAKIDANRIADLIQINIASIEKHPEHSFLFHDMPTLLMKANDDLEAVIANRITSHKEAEAKRIEAQKSAEEKQAEATRARQAAEIKAAQDELDRQRTQAGIQYDKLKALADRKPRIQTKLNFDRALMAAEEERVAACKEQAAGPAHPIMCPHCQGLTQIIHGVLVEYQEPVQKYNPELVGKLPEYEKALLLSKSAVANGERDLRAAEDAELQMKTIANNYQFKEAA
jgi:predicted phage-related endonuclease